MIHVVRDPLHQISSFTAHTNKTYNFLYDVITHHTANVFSTNLMELFVEVRLSYSVDCLCMLFMITQLCL